MFKRNFRQAHLELTKTGELTLKEAGYGQVNIVEDIASRLSAEFQHQEKMVNSDPPEDPAPPIATGTEEIIQQVMAQNKDLMRLFYAKDEIIGRNNTNRPPPYTGPCQGQPHHSMPGYLDKYFWTHGRGSHKGRNFNSK